MNHDVDGFYTHSIPNDCRSTSFESVVSVQKSGALQYRFGIG